MYELKKKMERYLRVNLLGPGPRLMKKGNYLAAVSQRLRNNGVEFSLKIMTLCVQNCNRSGNALIIIIFI